MIMTLICFFFGISLYFNLKQIYHYFHPTKEFYFGDAWIFRNRIIILKEEKDNIIDYEYRVLSKDGPYKFGHLGERKTFSAHRKVLEREAVLYTDELWNSLLEKEKIKQEIEEVLKKENVKV